MIFNVYYYNHRNNGNETGVNYGIWKIELEIFFCWKKIETETEIKYRINIKISNFDNDLNSNRF